MVAAFTYYKKCICSEGTSTTYAPGCPIHDPRMKAAFECSNCKRLEAENKRLINIAGDALGFSEYQRDQFTVEVLANHCKRLAKELAALAECKAERDEARELVTMRLEDMNKDGKTILDFYAVWLRQSRDETTKLRARCERLEGALKILADDKGPANFESWEVRQIAGQALEVPRE